MDRGRQQGPGKEDRDQDGRSCKVSLCPSTEDSQWTTMVAVRPPPHATLPARVRRDQRVGYVLGVRHCVAEAAVALDFTRSLLLTARASPLGNFSGLHLLQSGIFQTPLSPISDAAEVEGSVAASLDRLGRGRRVGVGWRVFVDLRSGCGLSDGCRQA